MATKKSIEDACDGVEANAHKQERRGRSQEEVVVGLRFHYGTIMGYK